MTATTSTLMYDPSTAQFQADIWEIYRRLRDEQPVYRDPGGAFYVLVRFDDVWRAVNDWSAFSSVVAEAQSLLPQMIYFDPPRHTAMRALVSRAFTPKRVAEMEQLARRTARELIDGFAARGGGDVQHDFAAVLPSVVIAKMIGVADDHIPAVSRVDRVVSQDQGTGGLRRGGDQDLRAVRPASGRTTPDTSR